MFNLAPSSQTPSIYVLPFVYETKFYTHTNYMQNQSYSMYFNICFSHQAARRLIVNRMTAGIP